MERIYEYLCDAVLISVSAALVSVLSGIVGASMKKYIELLVGIAVILTLAAPFSSFIWGGDGLSFSFSAEEHPCEYEEYSALILRRAEQTAALRASELICRSFMMDADDFRVTVRAALIEDEVKIVMAYLECDTFKRYAIKEYLSEILGCEVDYG